MSGMDVAKPPHRHPHLVVCLPRKFFTPGFRSFQFNDKLKDDRTEKMRAVRDFICDFAVWYRRYINRQGEDNEDGEEEERNPLSHLQQSNIPSIVTTYEAVGILEPVNVDGQLTMMVPENCELVRVRVYFEDHSTLPYGCTNKHDVESFQENSGSHFYDCLQTFLKEHFQMCAEEDKKMMDASFTNMKGRKERKYASEFARQVRNWDQLRQMCALYAKDAISTLHSTGNASYLLEIFSERTAFQAYSAGICETQRKISNYMTKDGYFGVYPIPNRVWMIREFSVRDVEIRLFPWVQSDISPSDPLFKASTEFIKEMSIEGQAERILQMQERDSKERTEDEKEREKRYKQILSELESFYGRKKKELPSLYRAGQAHLTGLRKYLEDEVLRPNARVRIQAQDKLSFEELGKLGEQRLAKAFADLAKEKITDPKELETKRAEAIRMVRDQQMKEFEKIWSGDGDMSPVCQVISEFEKKYLRDHHSLCFPFKRAFADLTPFGEFMANRIHELEVAFKFAFMHDHAILAFLAGMNTYAQDKMGLHTLFYGPPGTGKSNILIWLFKLLIKGTITKFDYQSTKANATSSVTNDDINIVEEVPKQYVSETKGGDMDLAIWKAWLSYGETTGRVSWIDPETGDRSTRVNRGECRSTLLGATNLILQMIDKAMQDRFAMVYMAGHPTEQHRVFEKSQKSGEGDDWMKMTSLDQRKWQRDQIVAARVHKMIISKALPPIDLTYAERILTQTLARGNARGLSRSWEIRHYERMRMALRSLVIWNATHTFFDLMPNEETLAGKPDYHKMAPLLVASEEQTLFIFRLFHFQYDDAVVSYFRKICVSVFNEPLSYSDWRPTYHDASKPRMPDEVKHDYFHSDFEDNSMYRALSKDKMSVTFRGKDDRLSDAFWDQFASVVSNWSHQFRSKVKRKGGVAVETLARTLQYLSNKTEARVDRVTGEMSYMTPFKIVIHPTENIKTGRVTFAPFLVVNYDWLKTGGLEESTGERVILDTLQHNRTREYKVLSGIRVEDLVYIWKTHTLKKNPHRSCSALLTQSTDGMSGSQSYVLSRGAGMDHADDYDPDKHSFDARKLLPATPKDIDTEKEKEMDLDTYYMNRFHTQIGWPLEYRILQGMSVVTPREMKIYWDHVFEDKGDPRTPVVQFSTSDESKIQLKLYTYEMFEQDARDTLESRNESARRLIQSPIKPVQPPAQQQKEEEKKKKETIESSSSRKLSEQFDEIAAATARPSTAPEASASPSTTGRGVLIPKVDEFMERILASQQQKQQPLPFTRTEGKEAGGSRKMNSKSKKESKQTSRVQTPSPESVGVGDSRPGGDWNAPQASSSSSSAELFKPYQPAALLETPYIQTGGDGDSEDHRRQQQHKRSRASFQHSELSSSNNKRLRT